METNGNTSIGRNELENSKNFKSNGFKSKPAIKKRAKIVIIGAGLAGLAAAQRLNESGQSDVLLLEAQTRPGGRVQTISHGPFLLELGAQWLHGAQDNPLHAWLSSQQPQMLDDFEEATQAFEGIFCTNGTMSNSQGQQIDSKLVMRVLDILNASKLTLTRLGEFNLATKNSLDANNNNNNASSIKEDDKQDCSASELFRRHLESEILLNEDLEQNRSLVEAIFRWFLRFETIENGCNSMDEVSLASYTDWNDSGEGTLLNFKRGYASLLEWFCERFPKNKWLHLNRQVLNIELLNCEKSGRVLINYKEAKQCDQNASSQVEIIECEHVIVTSSLGFLKKNLQNNFFKPPLPEKKQQLIRSLGFGTVNKIILQFRKPFWQASSIKLVWASNKQQDDQLPRWTRDILSFDVVRRQPNLLIGWIGGLGAHLMEGESDEMIGTICLKVLERFLPNWQELRNSIELVSCQCSRWHSNEFTCGSYSFQSMASAGLNLDYLHEPICADDDENVPRILFAGEATAGRHYSTTHGAIISGWREADRLIEHLRRQVDFM